MSEISRWESTAMKLAERLRASEAQTESWIILARLANESRFNAEAKVKELESFIVALWCEFGIGGDIDGGWLQDEMEKRGLIVPHVVTEDEYDEESEFRPGDTIYHLSPAFRGEEER